MIPIRLQHMQFELMVKWTNAIIGNLIDNERKHTPDDFQKKRELAFLPMNITTS